MVKNVILSAMEYNASIRMRAFFLSDVERSPRYISEEKRQGAGKNVLGGKCLYKRYYCPSQIYILFWKVLKKLLMLISSRKS